MGGKDDVVEGVKRGLGAAGAHHSKHVRRGKAIGDIVDDELNFSREAAERRAGGGRDGRGAGDKTVNEK